MGSHFLVRQHRVALQVGAEQGGPRPIVLTEDGSINVVEAVARDQPVSARRTGETLEKDEGNLKFSFS